LIYDRWVTSSLPPLDFQTLHIASKNYIDIGIIPLMMCEGDLIVIVAQAYIIASQDILIMIVYL
jgi:hypothetical protein